MSIFLLSFFWLIRSFKHALFWLYLWQLKNYHVGRFLAHFDTHKGRKLIFSPLLGFKIILILFFLTVPYFDIFLTGVYFAEAAIFFRQILKNSFIRPKFTFKAKILSAVLFAALVFIAADSNVFYLLLADILLPIIASAVVLIFQPLSIFLRNRILQKARVKMRQHKNLLVIGITGSYGKTSTKEFLATILSKKYKVLNTNEHQNSEIGIAQCVLNDLKPFHEVFIVEMGAYNRGGIKLLCGIVNPKIGIVTGVNEQHLPLFGSLENLLSAEGGRELAQALPKDGVLILNGENSHCLSLAKRSPIVNTKIYGFENKFINFDTFATETEIKKESVSFIARAGKDVGHFSADVLGKHLVLNLLGAILTAKELGMNFEEISAACKDISQSQGGMTLRKNNHGIYIIDSSYSANPDGVLADLDYLNIFEGKKAVIMPCLIELGNNSAQIHQEIGKKIAEVCDMAIITTKDYFNEIKSEAGDKVIFMDNSQEIYNKVTTTFTAGDAVLLEGRVPSKLHELF